MSGNFKSAVINDGIVPQTRQYNTSITKQILHFLELQYISMKQVYKRNVPCSTQYANKNHPSLLSIKVVVVQVKQANARRRQVRAGYKSPVATKALILSSGENQGCMK
jgi:hypothetical protein